MVLYAPRYCLRQARVSGSNLKIAALSLATLDAITHH